MPSERKTKSQIRTERAQAARSAVCEDCGASVEYSGAGRPSRWCPEHRLEHKRASQRAAQKAHLAKVRASRPPAKIGGKRQLGPKVVERTQRGYRELHRPTSLNASARGKVAEHRHVLGEHLQRRLRRDEQVHHINGDRQDNRLENLELWSTRQPPGQRIEDKTAWALEWLADYAPDALAQPPRDC